MWGKYKGSISKGLNLSKFKNWGPKAFGWVSKGAEWGYISWFPVAVQQPPLASATMGKWIHCLKFLSSSAKTLSTPILMIILNKYWRYCPISFNSHITHHSPCQFVQNVTLVLCHIALVQNHLPSWWCAYNAVDVYGKSKTHLIL